MEDQTNNEFEYIVKPLKKDVQVTDFKKDGVTCKDVTIGNTGFTITIDKKENEFFWFQHFMPGGRARAIPEMRNTSTLLYPLALVEFLNWYKDDNNFHGLEIEKPTVCYGTATNEQMHNYFKNLFSTNGEQVFEEVPEEQSYSDEISAEVTRGAFSDDKLFGSRIDLTMLLANKEIMARLQKLHDYALTRITEVPTDPYD